MRVILTISAAEMRRDKKRGFKMKRALVVLMAMLFAGMAANVQAANVTFNPGSVALTVEPGKSAAVNLVVNADSRASYTINLRVGSLAQGNLPPGWLRPANVSLVARRGGVSAAAMSLVVNVPADTPGGTYTAVVTPQILQATEPVVSRGVAVVVEVPSQKKCTGVPAFENVKVGPENIWAPKNKEVEIDISGTVVVAPGCEVAGTYSMESNDGPVAGDLTIDADGNFAQKINVKVSKKGKAREGRVYNGELVVVDAEGNSATKGFFVKVGHDRGKKKGHKKDWKKSWNNRWQKYWHKDR